MQLKGKIGELQNTDELHFLSHSNRHNSNLTWILCFHLNVKGKTVSAAGTVLKYYFEGEQLCEAG